MFSLISPSHGPDLADIIALEESLPKPLDLKALAGEIFIQYSHDNALEKLLSLHLNANFKEKYCPRPLV